ncbi:hypothetical protein H0H93_003917 [Arthromyces matolae]|nr:hypothetical protein H0H93_003917 [Arthromyces matolae]
MGPPRRSSSYISPPPPTSGSESSNSPLSQNSNPVINSTNSAMSSASRYQLNLKALRRRDPSIISIFDQFSHVCLYHHNGTKWEKLGYEGSMFLYESLHSYIKRNQPYPQEFRYGPDRPPPMPSATPSQVNRLQTNAFSSLPVTPSSIGFTGGTNGGPSELDRLFARMQPTPAPSTATPLSILTSLGGANRSQSVSLPSPPSSATVNTGLSLLDSIFASASKNPSASTSTSTIPIHNPVPTNNATPLVLDQATLSSLLGLPPSRTASAASTAYSTDARSSHSSSREGDNEEDDDTSDGGAGVGSTSDAYSESSTVLDPDAEFDDELQAAGASAGRPLIAEPVANVHENGHGRGRSGRINGDVTPRPPVNGFMTPPFGRQPRAAPTSDPASVVGRRQNHRQLQDRTSSHSVPLGSERPLVPFDSDSALWPYQNNNTTVTTTSSTNHHNNNGSNHVCEQSSPSDDEIIELDFEDTSVLSDPDAFRTRHRTNGTAKPVVEKKRAKKKLTRKERAAEQAREREEIEKSWDAPVSVPAFSVGVGMYNQEQPPSPASPPPQPSPEPEPSRRAGPSIPKNGHAASVYPPLREGQKVVPEAVRDSVITAVRAVGTVKTPPPLERNDFVREVLTLIHTDKAFVDSLYKDYTRRVG